MKQPRIISLTDELKATVDRLNRLTEILELAGVTYKLPRVDGKYEIAELIQKIEY
mgnify:CR=1 FL=1